MLHILITTLEREIYLPFHLMPYHRSILNIQHIRCGCTHSSFDYNRQLFATAFLYVFFLVSRSHLHSPIIRIVVLMPSLWKRIRKWKPWYLILI